MNLIESWVFNKAHPNFNCENCIGMGEYGCYCSVMNASSPGNPPTLTQKIALKIWNKYYKKEF